jgi:hypothetical protein
MVVALYIGVLHLNGFFEHSQIVWQESDLAHFGPKNQKTKHNTQHIQTSKRRKQQRTNLKTQKSQVHIEKQNKTINNRTITGHTNNKN